MRKKIYSKYWARERRWMSRESNLPVREVFSRDFRNRRALHTPDSCMNLVVYFCLRLLVFVFTFGQKRQSVTRSRVLQDIHNKYEWVRTALALNLLLSRTRIAQIVFYRNSRFSAALYCLLIILISIDCDSDAANPFLFASNKSHQYFCATVRMNGTLSFSFSLFYFFLFTNKCQQIWRNTAPHTGITLDGKYDCFCHWCLRFGVVNESLLFLFCSLTERNPHINFEEKLNLKEHLCARSEFFDY